MDRLECLRCFCIASETLSFKKTASQLAVSPQVVTRAIAELELQLGETLFKRSTRSVQLTEFGTQFLPRAEKFLAEEKLLFAKTQIPQDRVKGIVRITLPPLPNTNDILSELLIALEDYPDIVIDWKISLDKVKIVDEQIDIGLRICLEPESTWIAHHICDIHEKIVASPALVQRLGHPKNLLDLQTNYPLSGLFNLETGRIWNWYINQKEQINILEPKFITTDMFSELQSALVGRTCAQLMEPICNDYIHRGELVDLFPNIDRIAWKLYLYRPYQRVVPLRVTIVFDRLKSILQRKFQKETI